MALFMKSIPLLLEIHSNKALLTSDVGGETSRLGILLNPHPLAGKTS